MGGIHRTGADTHHHTIEMLHALAQTELVEEAILGRYVTATEDDEVGIAHHAGHKALGTAVEHLIAVEGEVGMLEDLAHLPSHTVGDLLIVGIGTDEETTDGMRQGTTKLVEEAVGRIEVARPSEGGAAGKEECHCYIF